MQHLVPLEVFVCLSVFLSTIIMSSEAAPTCRNDNYIRSGACKYGFARDYCHRAVCARGPGERCGGPWNRLGKCTTGTYCACGRCTGCATQTLQCYHGEFC